MGFYIIELPLIHLPGC